MNQNQHHTLIPVESFEGLTQADMVAELRKADPERAKGQSRARKADLVELYRKVMAEKLAPDGYVANTGTGRLRSDRPNHSNAPQADRSPTGRTAAEPVIQNIPLRTEEGKQLAKALRETEEVTYQDLSALETRLAEVLENDPTTVVVTGVAPTVTHPLNVEPQSVVLYDEAHVLSSGAEYPMMSDQPVEMVVPRKETVVREVSRLGQDKIQILARYKAVPKNGNRRMRKIRSALARKIFRFLPKGVTLEEAVGVLA